MEKYVKEITINKNKNNVNGVFSINNTNIFYKVLNDSDYKNELIGYEILKQHYNVCQKYFSIQKNGNNIVCYDYNENIYKNNGLIVDYFANNDILTNEYKKILKNYYNVFKSTIKKNKKGNCRIFFEDRLDNRLLTNIKNKYFKIYDGSIIKFNKKVVKLDNKEIYRNIIKYFKKERKTWNVISNADPNDMNIGIDGVLFDYTAGGYVPIMCEFAVFMCYNLVQSEYLSLKYNCNAFKEHNIIYKFKNKVKVRNNMINHFPRKIRIDAIINYIDIIIKPIMKNIKYDEWYDDFKNYFAMKLLAVYNFDEMNNKDILLSLTYLNLFYNNNFNTIDDLKNFIIEIYEVIL